MKDIKESFPNDKVLLLTTPPYVNFMSTCPYINGVLIDKRLPRWNIFYLLRLRKMLSRFKFEKVFALVFSKRIKSHSILVIFLRNFDKLDTNSLLAAGVKSKRFSPGWKERTCVSRKGNRKEQHASSTNRCH